MCLDAQKYKLENGELVIAEDEVDIKNKNKPELFMINHSIVAKTA